MPTNKTVIWFTSASCAPCKKLLPKMRSAAEMLDVDLQEVSIDDDAGFQLAQKFGVLKVPTIVLPAVPEGPISLDPTRMLWPKVVDTIEDLTK